VDKHTEKFQHFIAGNGRVSGKRLFHERAEPEDRIAMRCPFYLSTYIKDKNEACGQRSAYRIFLDADSEYEAALEIVGDYGYWIKLTELVWFYEGEYPHLGLKVWREHKALKEEQEALAGLRAAAKEGNVTAQKELYGISQKQKKAAVGRPKKEEEDTDFTKVQKSSVANIFKDRKV